MTKRCWKCKEEKTLDMFWKDASKPDGKQKACIECQSARNKVYAADHSDYFKQKGKEKYHKEENPARYLKYQEGFLRRRREHAESVRGRLVMVLGSARSRSRRYNRAYDLDIEWLLNLHSKQSGCCLLTGIPLEFSVNANKTRRFIPFAPSLDRIDSDDGYTKDNTRLVCVAVNLALNRFGEDLFTRVAEGFLKTRKGRETTPPLPEVT